MHSPPTRLLKEHGCIHPAGQIPTGAIRGQALGFGQYGKGGAARGASDAVLAALRSEVRDPSNIHTMTAAERRLFEARRDFLYVQQGINPYSEFALRLRGAPLISGYDKPLTPAIAAEVEKRYFIASQANGDAVKMRALYKDYAGVSLSATEVEGLFALASAEQIVLQAASKKVRRIHKSVDLAEVNRRKTEALERAGTTSSGSGRKPPPPRKRTAFSEDPEDFSSPLNQSIIRKTERLFEERNVFPSYIDDILTESEYKEFMNQLRSLSLDADSMRVGMFGMIKRSSRKEYYAGGHFFYADVPNKTLFPEHWDETTIVRAFRSIRESPLLARVERHPYSGQILAYSVRGVYDGVMLQLEWIPGQLDFPNHFYPVFGHKVFKRDINRNLKEVRYSGADLGSWWLCRDWRKAVRPRA